MRRSDMRKRVVAIAAVAGFAVGAIGVAVVVARSSDDGPPDPLPVLAGPERAAQGVTYHLEGPLPDVPDAVLAFRLGDANPEDRKLLADAVGTDRLRVGEAPGSPWHVEAREPTVPVADLPSRDDAFRRADTLFDDLGVEGMVEVSVGPAAVEASVSPYVQGQPTVGYGHRLSFGAQGEIVAGHGYLGRPKELGFYPLVDAAEGLERLQSGLTLGARAEPSPRGPRVVTHVELGLALVEGYLVPAYLFRGEDGRVEAVPAVVDRLLGKAGGKEPRPVPVTEPELPDGAQSCGVSLGGVLAEPARGDDGQQAEEPLTVEVCGPARARVGEEVAFEVTANDPDAEIIESGCGGPQVLFGDEEGAVHAGCMPACAAPLKVSGPGKLQRTFRHAYAKPGTYTATFEFQSAFCTKGSSHGEGTHTITVE